MARRDTTTTMADALKIVGGGVVGVGIALLLAPRTGKETRKDIVRYAKTLGSKTNEAVYDFADSIADFTRAVGEKGETILQSGEEMTAEAKNQLISAIEKGQDRLEKQKNRM